MEGLSPSYVESGIFMRNEIIRLVTTEKLWSIEPDPSTVVVPDWPANSIIPHEYQEPYSEVKLRSFVTDKYTKLASPKPIASLVMGLPENYCLELINHVRYGHNRKAGRLPIYLGNTVLTAAQGLTDLVLAANMARSIFTDMANTTNPTKRAEARNWLNIARQMEYTALKVLKTKPEPRIVIAKATAEYGTGEFQEIEDIYFLDKSLLDVSGKTAEQALIEFKQSQEPNDG